MKFTDKQIKIFDICAIAAALVVVILNIVPLTPLQENSSAEEAMEEFISINQLLTNELSNHETTLKLDKNVEKFLKKWEIKGGSLAIMKGGKLVYAKGYGWADEEMGIKAEAGHIYRVASLSKLITATAIMKMAEDSLLSLDDKVFGEGGILDEEQFSHYRDKRVPRITVEHLLRHKGGFTLRRGDPLFITRDIMRWEKLDTVPDMDRVIEFTLDQRLGFNPGGSTKYSNAGYLILTKVIEKLTGMSYEEYCQKNILYPAGCYDMHLAKNLYEDKYPNEVRYYEQYDATPIPAYNNSGDTLYRRYGGNNIEGLYGAGGWVASASEFVLFAAAIDGDESIPDILTPESIEKMITCHEGELPIGWSRAGKGSEWKRTGTLAGSSAILKRQKDGTIWMFVTNTSSWKGNKFPQYIETMVRRSSSGIEFPMQNLLDFI